MDNQFTNLFSLAGLTPEQAKIYELLLQKKDLSASALGRLVGIERSLTYKILGQLIELRLVNKTEKKGEIAYFNAEHPRHILEIVEKKRQETESAYEHVSAEIGKVSAAYNLTTNKPSIRFLEGLEGLRYLNKDILSVGRDIKLIRSVLDKVEEKSYQIIEEQIKRRVALGNKIVVVGPLPGGKNTTNIDALKAEDKAKLVERRVIDDLNVPAQVMLYGNKVAITDYKSNFLTTLIESESVYETFDKIFEVMFAAGRKL